MKRMATIAGATLVAAISAHAVCTSSLAEPARNPLATLLPEGVHNEAIHGRIEQRLPAGGYTYLALRRADESLLWTVTLGRGASLGERVSVRSMGRKTDFYSPRLKRTFPLLVFGIVSRAD